MGISKFLFKVVLAILLALTVICCCALTGCAPINGALAQKNSTVSEASNDSMNFGDGVVVDPVELVAAKTAQKTAVIRAEKEPWRIIAYTVGIPVGIGLICGIILAWLYIRAYLAESPWDGTRKRKDKADA